MTIADIERVIAKSKIADNGCWLWLASTNCGYGRAWIDGRSRAVHRALYIAVFGTVEAGLVLDHEFCNNRSCINPAHLVPKTDWENRLRSAWYGNSQECKRGHNRNSENTYTRPSGKQECRECRKLEMKRFYSAAGRLGGTRSRRGRKETSK